MLCAVLSTWLIFENIVYKHFNELDDGNCDTIFIDPIYKY